MARQNKPIVKVAKASYQPTQQELKSDLRVKATFDQAVQALCTDMTVQPVENPDQT